MPVIVWSPPRDETVLQVKVSDTVNNTTRSFLIDVIIRNQGIKKLINIYKEPT